MGSGLRKNGNTLPAKSVLQLELLHSMAAAAHAFLNNRINHGPSSSVIASCLDQKAPKDSFPVIKIYHKLYPSDMTCPSFPVRFVNMSAFRISVTYK